MKEWLFTAMEYAVVAIDAIAFVVIVIATVDVVVRALRAEIAGVSRHDKRDVWLRYARFLIVALTFQLAADIVESSISTSWEAIGPLAAVAVIRTFLEYFLDRDIAEVRERQRETGAGRQESREKAR